MRCADLMKQDLKCLTVKDSVLTAARMMRAENIGFLPVCDSATKVLGTITDRDIVVRVIAEDKPTSTRAADVMTREVISCRPDDDLRTAEELMIKNQKSRIMCIDEEDRLVGVISLSDIAQAEETGRTGETMAGVSGREAHF